MSSCVNDIEPKLWILKAPQNDINLHYFFYFLYMFSLQEIQYQPEKDRSFHLKIGTFGFP